MDAPQPGSIVIVALDGTERRGKVTLTEIEHEDAGRLRVHLDGDAMTRVVPCADVRPTGEHAPVPDWLVPALPN